MAETAGFGVNADGRTDRPGEGLWSSLQDAFAGRCDIHGADKGGDMGSIPTGTESMRPFIPAQDFERSKSFYETIGFEKVFDGEVAIFDAGSGGFILQRYYQKQWAENFMMQLLVDDLDAWWAHIEELDLRW